MRMNLFYYLLLSILIIGFAAAEEVDMKPGSVNVKGISFQKYAGMAKIDYSRAAEIALEKNPGIILEIELENEDGYLIYGVELATQTGNVIELMVDAGNGEILGREIEDDGEENGDVDDEAGEKDDDEEEESEKGSIKVGKHMNILEAAQMARITAVEAARKAIAREKGDFLAVELEKDDGVLLYEVILYNGGKNITEIEVDAGSGDVLEVENEKYDENGEDED